MADQQRIIIYKGQVQGVGFRYTACRIAQQHDVAGYVQNLEDGTVKVVAEGASSKIELFLEELSENSSGYISSQSQQIEPYTGRYDGFVVRR